MAGFYHLSVKMLSRANGKAVVASAAYRAGDILRDERYGKTYDYSPRRGIAHKAILAPDDAPEWALNREHLWNRVETIEKRKDAQLARELELALPHQLSGKEKTIMVETFIREQLIPLGMIVDYAIHAPNRKGDERNWHAHLLTTLRPVAGGDLSPLKDREACRPEKILQWRRAWAEIQNRTFERLNVRDQNGEILRVDHRSFEDRGIGREATQHMGVHAAAMERKGERTEIGDRNRAIMRGNAQRERQRETPFYRAREQAQDEFQRPGKDGGTSIDRTRGSNRDDREF
jgi:ATP-dependent exoDNAse (exonuclease V) alpha subunit